MATVNATLHVGRQTVTGSPGDLLVMKFNTGDKGDQPSKVSISSPGSTQLNGNMTDASGSILAGSQLGPSITVKEQWNSSNPDQNNIKQPIGKNVELAFNVTVDPKVSGGPFGFTVDLTIGR